MVFENLRDGPAEPSWRKVKQVCYHCCYQSDSDILCISLSVKGKVKGARTL